jgi:hypothetical protein
MLLHLDRRERWRLVLDFNNRDTKEKWPGRLDPKNEDFAAWWIRHHKDLAHLEPRLVEQWVHRHWRDTPFKFIPLPTLKWKLERWPTERILSEVRRARQGRYDPANWDRRFKYAGKQDPTVQAFAANGTWDYPIVVLQTPTGVSLDHGYFPDVRFLLIEGHNRWRYLSVLRYRQVSTGPHEVFLLESPVTSEQVRHA